MELGSHVEKVALTSMCGPTIPQWAPPIKRRVLDPRVNLDRNELVHPLAEAILEQVPKKLAAVHLRRYPLTAPAVECLAEYFLIDTAEMMITPGSDSAIRLICSDYAQKAQGRGRIILQQPNYNAWEDSARFHGMTIHGVAADWANYPDQGVRLADAARRTSDALIAVSVPNGPAGGCLTADQLDTLAEAACERRHLLIIDSCYQAFHGPIRDQIARHADSVLVVQSLSKSHGLAGARLAVLCGTPERIADLGRRSHEHMVSGTSLLAAQFLTEHHATLQIVWDEIRETRDRTAQRVRQWGLTTLPAGGNFLTVQVGMASRAAAVTRGMSEVGYCIRDLSNLPSLAGYVRFTIADEMTMWSVLHRLHAVLDATSDLEAR